MGFSFGLGCDCCDGSAPCGAYIAVCVCCALNEITIDISGATVDTGDLTPAAPYLSSDFCGGYVSAGVIGITIPTSPADVTVSISGTGLNSDSAVVSVSCGQVVSVFLGNLPATLTPTTRAVTVDGYHGTVCPVEDASVEHTGCCTGTSGLTDADGYVSLAVDQCNDCGGSGSVTVTPPTGYGAVASTESGPCPSCDTPGTQTVELYPDSDHIGHGTYGPNEMLAGFLCSGRYLPYQVPYEDDDGGCTLAFTHVDDLPSVFAGCVDGGHAWWWYGSFSFAPTRIGEDVDCEGAPNCQATDNPSNTEVTTYILARVIGDCDGATVYVRRCTAVVIAATDCSFLDTECVYPDPASICMSGAVAYETMDDSVAITCPSGSFSASGTMTAAGSLCDTGRSVSWSMSSVI